MSTLFAMTLPGLVVILVVVGVIEVLSVRRRRRRGDTAAASKVAWTGFDVLGLALAPSTRHKLEHDEFLESSRHEAGDSAPPRSHVDLDTGIAHLVVPQSRPPA